MTLNGPPKTPYEGGKFTLQVDFPPEYPFKAPKVKFMTKIYHPNVDEAGTLCVGIMKSEAWKPSTKAQTSEYAANLLKVSRQSRLLTSMPIPESVLLSIVQLLEEPNPDDALVGSIGELCSIQL